MRLFVFVYRHGHDCPDHGETVKFTAPVVNGAVVEPRVVCAHRGQHRGSVLELVGMSFVPSPGKLASTPRELVDYNPRGTT